MENKKFTKGGLVLPKELETLHNLTKYINQTQGSLAALNFYIEYIQPINLYFKKLKNEIMEKENENKGFTEDNCFHFIKQIMSYCETKTTCILNLDKQMMLKILSSKAIEMDGEYFKVPEKTILNCLLNHEFKEVKLELERIETK